VTRAPSRAGAATVLATALAICLLGPLSTCARAAARAYIRLDQVGYQPNAPKRAYVLSTKPEAGASFTVLNQSSEVVLSGSVGAALGRWNGRAGEVYPLDFDSLATPGTYTIVLAGKAPASSPPFAVAPPAQLYEAPLSRALGFYENERDGPEYIPSALRSAPAHLNDEDAMTYSTPAANDEGVFKGELQSLGERIDAAGGWWDAGDYLKFVQTTSYAVALQLVGVRDFPAELGKLAGASNFSAEARFGVEWLLRMFNDSTGTLYYQVGIGSGNAEFVGDHDIWRLPQEDDTYGGSDPRYRYIRERPVFRAGPPGSPVSPNLAGRDAAAFALCFQVFAATEPELASRCLRAGEHIFDLAETDPTGRLLTTFPYSFYPETEWRDDLELGASELSIALADASGLPSGLPHTEARYYLEQAAHWAHAYIARSGTEGEGLNLYDVSGLADFELVRALRREGDPGGLETSEAALLGDLSGKLERAVTQSHSDPFGFGFPRAESDTVAHGLGLSVMASEYDYLVSEPTYRTFSQRWLANVLGANAWGSSFIIGDGSVFTDCPQHQVANIVGSLDGSPPILAGAVVEGPSNEKSRGKLPGMRACPAGGGEAFARFDNAARYRDNVQSFTNTEPALDLTAPSLLAFAWQTGEPSELEAGL
jgi:endoglucanase